MRYEWKKLLQRRPIRLVLIGLFLLNATLFYARCTVRSGGFSPADAAKKYDRADLAAEAAQLEACLQAGGCPEDSGLMTGDAAAELALDRVLLAEKEAVAQYPDYLRSLLAEIKARLQAGFSGKPGDWEYRAQKAVLARYQRLLPLRPSPSFGEGIAVFSGWFGSDMILLLALLTAGLLLFPEERTSGTLLLLRSTRYGRGRLFLQKLTTMLSFGFCALILLYGTDAAISAVVLGFGSLARPIQTVPGFLPCPAPLTVIGYICMAGLEKLLWLTVTVCAAAFLCAWARRPMHAVLFAAGASLLSIILGSARFPWLQCLSLSTQSDPSRRWSACRMLNRFGLPISEQTAFLLCCGLLLPFFLLGGWFAFCRRDTVTPSRGPLSGLPIGRHTCLGRHEARKLLLGSGGAVLLLLLLAAEYGLCMQFPHQVTDYERYLRGYSAELSSGSDEENRAYLHAEAARFAKLQEEIDFYEARCGDFSELQALTAKQRRELKAQPAFEQADAQYRSLRPGELYVHPTAYQRLFGPQGIQNDLWSTALLGLVLSLALSPCFAREQETGVLTLQKTAGALGRATRSKRHLAAGLALSAAIAAYLPQMALIGGTYGLARLYAPAGGLPVFSAVPGLRIWQVFVVAWLARFALSAAEALIILALSKRLRSTVVTMLISMALFVLLPILLLLF